MESGIQIYKKIVFLIERFCNFLNFFRKLTAKNTTKLETSPKWPLMVTIFGKIIVTIWWYAVYTNKSGVKSWD